METRQRIAQIGSLALAAGLLWLALRGVDFGRVWSDLRGAEWGWLFPMIAAALLSHGLRAWRWTLFLDELDAENRRPVRTRDAFGALMVGYMANYAAPRLGEFVRTALVSSRERLRFSAVLGTVATDRLLDMATLAVALLTIPLALGDRLGEMQSLLQDALTAWRDTLAAQWMLFAAVAVVLAVSAVIGWRHLRDRAPGRIRRVLHSFGDGLRSVARTPRRGALVTSTVLMWLCYAVMAWLPLLMFDFDTSYGVTPVHAWGLMLIGALGIVVPSPGGIGSYHFITIQALVLMFGFSTSEAATYAIVSHAGQLVLYVVTGFVVMVVQGISFSDLSTTRTDA